MSFLELVSSMLKRAPVKHIQYTSCEHPYCGFATTKGHTGPMVTSFAFQGCMAPEYRCKSGLDSDLEAFSHNPAHGSFAPLAFQPSAMTNCANQRFLSY